MSEILTDDDLATLRRDKGDKPSAQYWICAYKTLRDRYERYHDLVRHQRSELSEANLIDDDEYAALVLDGPDGAVARLEGYDKLRARCEEAERQVKKAEEREKLLWDSGSLFLANTKEAQVEVERLRAALEAVKARLVHLKGTKPVHGINFAPELLTITIALAKPKGGGA